MFHLHSDFSNGTTNIDSITNYKEYIQRAKECGMKSLGFSEHGNIFSWLHKKEEIEKAGMKYLHCMEAYITENPNEKVRDNYHCVLIAKNYDGVLELNQLSSDSFNREDGHFYYMPRITFDELIKTSDNIIITTACLGGILHNGNDVIKDSFISFLSENKHRCFLEIQHHNDIEGKQRSYNQYLWELSKNIGVPLVAGTDTHALNSVHLEGRQILQKAKNVRFENEDSWDLTFKTYDELVEAYVKQSALPLEVVLEAIENTNTIADLVEKFEIDRSYKYPHLWKDSEKTFQEKIQEGITRRGVDKYVNYQEYLDRIEEELKAYRHNGAIDFMLLMEDIIAWCTIELINETCKLANIERLTPDNVDVNDIKVWNAIRDDTTQIFQWEGQIGQDYIKRLLSDENIKKFQKIDPNVDRMTLLSIGNSAIRPAGASYRDDLANGVIRKTGSVAIDEFLSNTFGYLVFQCQIIDFLHRYCGYTMGEADIVRRGFAKKTGTEQHIPRIKSGFIETMTTKYDYTVEKAEQDIVAFIQVIEDASNYLFSLNHSQPYSYEGYVSGWLRTYYPLEFLTTALNINKDKEDKTKALTAYAKKRGITVKSPKFRYSKSGYFYNKSDNTIYKGICSIKFVNEAISNELYGMADMKFDSFVDVLRYLKDNTSVNSRQLEILIKIDFFSEFGSIDDLLAYNEIFNVYDGKKQIKKDKAYELGLDYDLIRKYSTKETPKMFSDLDSNGLITELISQLPSIKTSLKTTIEYQMECLGYIDIVDKQYSGYCVVTDLNVDYSPKIKLYALANGNEIPVKMKKDLFRQNPLKRGDIIQVLDQHKDFKRKMINGVWTKTDEKEWWVDKYEVCQPTTK